MTERARSDQQRWRIGGALTQPSGRACSIVIGRFLGTVVVSLRGAVDELAATGLASTLEDLIDGQGNLAIAIDLGRVSRLGPSGVQVLCGAASRLERRGGRLWLSDPPDGILRVLNAEGLGRRVGYPTGAKPSCGAFPPTQNCRNAPHSRPPTAIGSQVPGA